MSDSINLLKITKDIEKLSLFEKLFLFDRIWKDLALAVDGFMIACTSNEKIMEEVMEHSDDTRGNESKSAAQTSNAWPNNVTSINSKNKE